MGQPDQELRLRRPPRQGSPHQLPDQQRGRRHGRRHRQLHQSLPDGILHRRIVASDIDECFVYQTIKYDK